MIQWKKRAFISGIFVLASTQVLAGQPIMIITPNMTSVDLPNSGTATVSYTVTNDTPQNQQQFSIFADSNIGDKAAKDAISVQNNTCTGVLPPHQNCGFDILLTGNSNLKNNFVLSPKVCVYNNLACSDPMEQNRVQVNIVNSIPVSLKAYVCDGPTTNLVYKCDVSGGNLTNCLSTGSDFVGPNYSAINSDKTMFYVPQPDTLNMTVCSFSSTGDLNCSVVPVPIADVVSGSLAVHPTNQFIYLSNTINQIFKCEPDFSSCTLNSAPSGQYEGDLTINPTGTYIYLPQSGLQIQKCSFQVGGDIDGSSCEAFHVPSLPLKIVINKTETLGYLVGFGAYLCQINETGNISGCSLQSAVPADIYTDIALNPDETYVYISTERNTILGCPILQDGTLGVCVDNSSFTNSGGIVFR